MTHKTDTIMGASQTDEQMKQDGVDENRDLEALFTTARAHAGKERRRTANERDAFHAFAGRLADIEPQTQTQQSVPIVQTSYSSNNTSSAIEEAYRETVMSVSHYDDEYDESYEEHVSREFDSNIAAVLTEEVSFEDRQKQAAIGATTAAAERRDDLVAELDAELASLDRNTQKICAIEAELEETERASFSALRFGSLEGYYTRLETLEDKCTAILDERQSTLVRQRRRISLPIDAPDIALYVYQNMHVNYPLVSTLAALIDRIGDLKSEINRAIYNG
jgi:hypothetical protein